jgi:hypothetical protein
MSRFERLAAKPKEVTIEGETFLIYPLGMRDVKMFIDIQKSDKAQDEFLAEIMLKTLKMTDPEVTEQEIERLPMGTLREIMEAIYEVNGLKEEGTKKEFLEKIKDAQSGTA